MSLLSDQRYSNRTGHIDQFASNESPLDGNFRNLAMG